jgi:hypothetical protein
MTTPIEVVNAKLQQLNDGNALIVTALNTLIVNINAKRDALTTYMSNIVTPQELDEINTQLDDIVTPIITEIPTLIRDANDAVTKIPPPSSGGYVYKTQSNKRKRKRKSYKNKFKNYK